MQKHLNAFTIAKNAQKCNWIVFIFEIFIHVSKLTQQFNRLKKKSDRIFEFEFGDEFACKWTNRSNTCIFLQDFNHSVVCKFLVFSIV